MNCGKRETKSSSWQQMKGSVDFFGRIFFPATNKRVPHISLVFREMWDTSAVSLGLLSFGFSEGD
jgi:hypothetical protein